MSRQITVARSSAYSEIIPKECSGGAFHKADQSTLDQSSSPSFEAIEQPHDETGHAR